MNRLVAAGRKGPDRVSRASRVRRAGLVAVAGMLALVLGADPATAGPVTAQIVTAEIARIDALVSRAENLASVELDLPPVFPATPLPAATPTVDDGNEASTSEQPAIDLDEPEPEPTVEPTPDAVPVPEADSAADTSAQGAATMSEMSLSTMSSSGLVPGSAGDWSATSLSPSATWGTSGATGSFTWTYPFRVPSVPAGPTPVMALAYGSGSSDGRVASTNNQTSAIGEGWDLTSGYVERKYVPCADDMDPLDDGRVANNVGHPTGDLCIGEDNATLVFNGSASELVKDKVTGQWRSKDDDGTRIERKTGAGNSDHEKEYWKVTTVDGTQYFFGQDKRPTDQVQTYSAWVGRVYGNHPLEDCWAASFAAAGCTQVWRWNLDYVVDPSGNTMTYFYAREWQRYGYDNNAGTTSYVRGGQLSRVEYGTRSGSEAAAPARVVLNLKERCLPTADFACLAADRAANPDRWPDVPTHLECATTATTCPDVTSPVFFSTTRLESVVTQIRKDSGTYATVDEWALGHSFLDPGDMSLGEDGTGKILWLDSIRHTGRGGDGVADDTKDISLPQVTFDEVMLKGRVDAPTDGPPAMWRPRLASIVSESGGATSVTYSGEQCTTSNVPGTAPADQAGNSLLCFPVRWQPEGSAGETIEYFHKYVVTAVVQTGNPVAPGGNGIVEPADSTVAGSGQVTTSYAYDAAGVKWLKTDGALVDPDEATYADYRGYSIVTTTTGGGTDGPVQKTATRYFRGVEGASLSSEGITATDRERFNGQAFATRTYNGSTTVSVAVTVPAQSEATATGADGTVARRISSSTSHGFLFNAAGTVEKQTTAVTTYDEYGQVSDVDDRGDTSVTTDDLCTRTWYNRNVGVDTYLVATIKRSETVSVACATAPTRPAQVVADSRVFYDGAPSVDTAPVRGLVTRSEVIDPEDGVGYVLVATSTYDPRGRVETVTDVLGRTTTTAYSHTASGLLASVTTTSPDPDGAGALKEHQSVTTYSPGTGQPLSTKDANGKITTGTYDQLGRLVSVRTPQHATTTEPSVEYEYEVSRTGYNAVLTRTLGADGASQHTSVTIFDGLLRQFQTQTESADAGEDHDKTGAERGRVLTHTFYDTAGRTATVTGRWQASGAVSVAPVQPPQVRPSQTTYTYDGAGRVTDEIFWVGNDSNTSYEKWRTVTDYDGLYTTVLPPAGGTPTTAVADARGRTVAQWQHLSRPDVKAATFDPRTRAATSYQATTYRYDHAGRLAAMTDPPDPADPDKFNTWTYGYDFAGRQRTAVDPDSGTTSTEYDVAGQVTTVTNGAGQVLAYTYDALGRTLTVRDGATDGPVRAQWVYDRLTDARGTVTGADGQVKGLATAEIRYRTPGDTTTAYVTSTTGFDAAYRPVGTTVSLPGDAQLGALAGKSYTTGYAYTADGQVSQVTLPAAGDLGKETVTTTYDTASMPEWMGGGFGWGTYVATSRFSSYGQPAVADLGNTYGAVVSWGYEKGTERLTSIGLTREGVQATELNLNYSYDAAGNVTAIKDTPAAPGFDVPAAADNQCFTYDILQRLTRAWTPLDGVCDTPSSATMGGAAPYWTAWKYDPLGNRTEQKNTAQDGTATTTTYLYGAGVAGPHAVTSASVQVGTATPVATTYAYDAAGRMTTRPYTAPDTGTLTQTLTWDPESELAQITTPVPDGEGEEAPDPGEASFVYTAGGDRLVRFDATGATVYLPGGQEVRADSAGALTCTRYYTYAGQTVAVRTGRGLGGVTSLVNDHHGTPVAAVPNTEWTTTSVRKLYTTPFGGTRGTSDASTVPGDKQFLGATKDDATGLTAIGARYFDETLGKFITVDPLLDLTDPQQWNAYAYAHNNPTSFSDPSGLLGFPSFHTVDGQVSNTHTTSGATCTNSTCGAGSAGGGAIIMPPVVVYVGDGNDIPAEGLPAGTYVEAWLHLQLLTSPNPEPWVSDLNVILEPCTDEHAMQGLACDSGVSLTGDDLIAIGYALFIEDYADCAQGNVSGCAWVAVGFIPGGKIAKLGDAAIDIARVSDDVAAAANTGAKLCSFAGATLVLMADGSQERIEDVEVGDEVIATDPETGEQLAREVTHVWVHQDDLFEFEVDGELIVTTEDHPFWSVTDQAWEGTEHLDFGEQVLTANGRTLTVTREVDFGSHRVGVAYNLTVAGIHTYHVGVDEVLVHNICPNITQGGLDHSFDRHAAQWFGGQPTKSAKMEEWEGLIERAAGSTKVVPWSSGSTLTNAHLARIDGKYFVAQFDRETGDLVTAFVPNNGQLGAMLNLLGK